MSHDQEDPVGDREPAEDFPALGQPVPPTSSPTSSRAVRSVYVHAPFCARRCFYCDFPVTVSRHGDLRGWLEALAGELRLVEEEGCFCPAEELETLYVGGGTPSVLGDEAMAGLAGVLGPGRLGSADLEWTAEVNPESFSAPVAEGWARAGVNRVSLGVQSFQAQALRWLQRLHGPQEPARAIAFANAAGIRNVSVDLMFGLPREVERDWRLELDSALGLGVPHLSLYGLTVERGTPLAKAVNEGAVSTPDEEDYRDQFMMASDRLRSEGFLHYEVSNFALPGFEARHNRAYWESAPYLGLGNGAHSFRTHRRRWNLRDWRAYQEAIRRGDPPWGPEENLGPEAVQLERIWLGLRTDRGIPAHSLVGDAAALVERWVREGRATSSGGTVRLTPAGWLVLDHLVVELDLAVGPPPSPMG